MYRNAKLPSLVNTDNLADFVYQYDAYCGPVSLPTMDLYSDVTKALKAKNDWKPFDLCKFEHEAPGLVSF